MALFVKSLSKPEVGRKGCLSSGRILQLVQQGVLFGIVECNIHVPQPLRSYFGEMQPIIKNTTMQWDDVGPIMADYAEKTGILKQGRQTLVGSFFTNNILLSTLLLK